MVDRLSDFEAASVAPIIGTPYRVNAVMADRVNRLIAGAPADLQPELRHAITSGYRDWETQTKLYMHYLSGGGLAAKPGASWHERFHGMAVDWNRATPRAWAYLKANAPGVGIVFPLGPRDPYHSQPIETVHGNAHAARGGEGALMANMVAQATGTPMPAVHGAEPPATPESVVPPAAPLAHVGLPTYQSTFISPPTKPIEAPPYRPIYSHIPHGHLPITRAPSMVGVLRSALADILRRR